MTAITKPKSKAERSTRTVVATLSLTPETVMSWELPPFQRPLQVNDKVRLLAEQIASNGGVIPGVITLGKLAGRTYVVDGQHRREAFILSEKSTGFADVRIVFFSDMAEMGKEFTRLNSQLVRLKPDDMLRGLEGSLPQLQALREACPFIGYASIRRNTAGPMLSMALVLRAWTISRFEVPGGAAASAVVLAENFVEEECRNLIRFLNCVSTAWGTDSEYYRLWGGLNLTLCAWLYRRIVLSPVERNSRAGRMDDALFTKAMMAVSANGPYSDWLIGRLLCERDRAPCYTRLTAIIGQRMVLEKQGKWIFPRPAWSIGKKVRG